MKVEIKPQLLYKFEPRTDSYKFWDDIVNCPNCKCRLEKNVIPIQKVEEIEECRACNLGVMSRNCNCKYKYCEVETYFITCILCNTCENCGRQLSPITGGIDVCFYCKHLEEIRESQEKYKKELQETQRQKQLEFNQKWSRSTPAEKLSFYGKRKLLILAEKKQLQKYKSYNKAKLLEVLSPIVVESDFPIK